MEPGCYVDDHHGQYAPDMLGELAQSLNPHIKDDMCPLFWRDTADRYEREGMRGASEWAWAMFDETSLFVLSRLDDCTEGGYWEWDSGGVYLVAHDEEGSK
jgi:hypothetical protein